MNKYNVELILNDEILIDSENPIDNSEAFMLYITKQGIDWFLNGVFHREDGPARIFNNGNKIWYKNGVKHREDGPAVIYWDDCEEYWLEGKFYTKDTYLFKTKVLELTMEEAVERFGVNFKIIKKHN